MHSSSANVGSAERSVTSDLLDRAHAISMHRPLPADLRRPPGAAGTDGLEPAFRNDRAHLGCGHRRRSMAYRLRRDESIPTGLRRLARKELSAASEELRRGDPPSDEAIH